MKGFENEIELEDEDEDEEEGEECWVFPNRLDAEDDDVLVVNILPPDEVEAILNGETDEDEDE